MIYEGMMLEVTAVAPDPTNARRGGEILPETVQDLADSMSALGLLQPIVVRKIDGADRPYMVLVGHRRLQAAIQLGWKTIPAIVTEGPILPKASYQVAENYVRRPMPVVDIWIAVAGMVRNGMHPPDIALSLGIDRRDASKLAKFGSMAPAVLDLIAAIGDPDELPSQATVGVIASAPESVQIEAMQAAIDRGARGQDVFNEMAARLRRDRIPKSRAIFDHSQMLWDEDMFAEVGDTYSTFETERFLELQTKAVSEMIVKEANRYNARLVDSMKDAESLGRVIWGDTSKRSTHKSGRIDCFMVVRSGWEIGLVHRYVVEPATRPTQTEGAEPDDDARDAHHTLEEDTPHDPRRFNDVGLTIFAASKEAAIITALRDVDDAEKLLGCLLLALGGSNVSVSGRQASGIEPRSSGFGHNRVHDIAIGIMAHHPSPGPINRRAVVAAAKEAIARIITAPHPAARQSTDEFFDRIGCLLDAANYLPRFDSPEVLSNAKGVVLREVWASKGNPKASVAQMRYGLHGNAPSWIPAEARFTWTAEAQSGPPDEDIDQPPEC